MTILAEGNLVRLRTIRIPDLKACVAHPFSLSATEPMTDLAWVRSVHDQTGFWTPKAGVAAFEVEERLVGTMQFYSPGPTVHGFEIGYSLHSEDDRGKGYGSEALRLFSDLLFAQHPECHRLQLIIAAENFADARTVEHCGYAAEGTLRKAHYTAPGEPADCLIYSRVRD
jgi:RimJ/RimL family protein N-acetyltransferase